ncbi:MAG: PaaI family thioesterase [Amphiplicatus sp.]
MTDTAHSPSPRPAPEGWALPALPDGFANHAGPFYFRKDGPVPGVGFFAEPRHANLGGVVHGGALATLADMALFDICFRALGRFRAATVTLNSEFLEPAPIGAFIEATGELTRAGRTLLFARGLISAEGKPVMSFSGSVRRLS